MSTFKSYVASVAVCTAAAVAMASVGGSPAGARTAPSEQSAKAAGTPGEVKTNKSCRPGRYNPSYRIRTAHEAPAVTHVRSHGIAPGGSRTVTRTAAFQQRLSANARFKYGSEVGASGVAKVLLKAEAKLNVQLAARGSKTTTNNVTITDVVSNPTNSNKIFVFYRGYTNATGAFRYYFCKIYYLPGQNYGPPFVTYRIGKWSSYRVMGEGALRCGAGSGGNALAAAALRIGCP
jgi:hypothetical protein